MAQGYTKGLPLDIDGTLSANSDAIVPSQKAVKTYVDAHSGGGGGGGTTTNSLTINNSGTGDASGATFNGSAAVTISYNTVGAQASNSNLTNLAALTYASTSFVKMTGANTFTLDTNTYLTSVGTGTTNELTYWSGTNAIGSLSTGTYPSLTELAYLKGVTSSVQTQLNGKATASGTTNYVSKFTGTSTLGNSQIIDNGSRVLIGTTTDNTVDLLQVNGTIQATNIPTIVTLSGDTAANNNNTYADITPSGGGGQSLSFPVVSGNKYYFKFVIRSTNSAAAGGLKLSINSSVTTSVLSFTATTAGATKSGTAVTFAQLAFDDTPNVTNTGTLSGTLATIEGVITPTSSGTVIGRFAKLGATVTVNPIIKAGSYVEYKILP